MVASLTKTRLKRMIQGKSMITSFFDFNRLILFGWHRSEMPSLKFRSDLDVKRLSTEDLSVLARGRGRFAEQARLYYEKRGIDSAYGIYMDGELVHTSWVYTSAEYSLEPFRRLHLKKGEVEIVNCFTLDKCRGLGIYPYMIQFLSRLQFQKGMERVYMLADHRNHASQRGIIKAGLKPLGHVTYLRIPASSDKSIYYRRNEGNADRN
jgi:hypothetical protein